MPFANRYGHVSEDLREYVITDPRTPRPWFNYMWNERYAGLISHTGGGFSFAETPRDNRLTRMRYNSLPWDRPGRYVIVKDADSGTYWSLSWAPTIDRRYDLYECRHGQGYTRIVTEAEGIRGEITYFVPVDFPGEVWRVRLTNRSGRVRRLQVYAFVELVMGNALNDIINQPNDKHFTEIRFDAPHHALVCTRRYWVLNKKLSVNQPNLEWPNNLYFTVSTPVTGFDGSLDAFIGRWRSEANPECIETGRMKNTEITAGDPVAALQSEIELGPEMSSDLAVVMALAPKAAADPYRDLGWPDVRSTEHWDREFVRLRQKWDRDLSAFHVETPDDALNAMLNVWNPYQSAVTFEMARNSGYYHGGLLFGTGLRDQFQDILGVVMTDPQRVRARLLNALRYQFEDGSTLHNFYKLADWGERTNHSDTPLWIPFGIVGYLHETADLSILDARVPYYDAGTDGTVYEHVTRAIDHALSTLTPRGLPRIWNGDWNDTLDKIGPEGKGETVWGAFFLAFTLQNMFELLERRGDSDRLARYRTEYERLGEAVNAFCWDGEWYLRAFRDSGKPVGTAAHAQGKIFINAQTWSVISGLATPERGTLSLASLKKHLLRRNGIQICWPSYTTVEEDVGLISRCVPGKKENGAIFNHASAWGVLALLLNGDIETAWSVYSSMLPFHSAADIDRYEVEPYVFAEYVTGPDHPTEGQASHSWLTGTAVWMLRIGLDRIIGLRTSLGGLTIDPHIPSSWKAYKAERRFRGKRFIISVANPDGKNRGVVSVRVNGRPFEGTIIDPARYSEEVVAVDVTLG